jgi:hypothetical protein
VPTPTEGRPLPPRGLPGRARWVRATLFAGPVLTLVGCGGPTDREVKNARAFEALLTAVSLKNDKELEKDAKLIDERHAAGELSDGNYQELQGIIKKARAKDWNSAEKRAYEFRAQFGDRGSYFK